MTTAQPPEALQLDAFVRQPREDLDVEYKCWLNLDERAGKATLAKAAIALANHGGGHIILGFQEDKLSSRLVALPPTVPAITQDDVNSAIRRFAEPEFHCQVYDVAPEGAVHPVIRVPASDIPVMSKRSQVDAGVSQHKFYIRKPGPRSEEPHTAEEWRGLIDRCVRARREVMLDAIRSIVLGQVEVKDSAPDPLVDLKEYCATAYDRWIELSSSLPVDSQSRFPYGYFEMGFALVGVPPAETLTELQNRLATAQRIKLTGWNPFLHMLAEEWKPYVYKDAIEAWLGRPIENRELRGPSHAVFWRASLDGKLYTIRGYLEDGDLARERGNAPGTEFSDTLPAMRIAEALLFASRFATDFEGAENIVIRCRFAGLNGRRLLFAEYPVISPVENPIIQDPEVVLETQVTLQQVDDNLPEIIHGLIEPLYERFEFYPVSVEQTRRMIQRLRSLD